MLPKTTDRRLKPDGDRSPSPRNGDTHREVSIFQWILISTCLFLAATTAFAAWDYFHCKLPPEIVGKWVVEEGPQFGGSFEFFRSGSLVIRLKNKEKEFVHRIHVTLEDKALVSDERRPGNFLHPISTYVIQELTPTNLILEFEEGEVLKMTRAS